MKRQERRPATVFIPRALVACLWIAAIAGCSKVGDIAPMQMVPLAGSASRHLAYEHSISVDVDERKLNSAFVALQAKCAQLANEGCEVLASHISAGRLPSASLRFRASEKGVQSLTAELQSQGEITDKTTNAEDLAAPMADTSKKLAMLTDYKAKLEALQARGGNDLDALIKLNRELAQVQSELEAATSTKAGLDRRVNTEVLNVALSSPRSLSFWRPISSAFAEFGGNLSQGISTAIIAVAYLLPWGLLLGLLVWIGRTSWLRRKRSKREG